MRPSILYLLKYLGLRFRFSLKS